MTFTAQVAPKAPGGGDPEGTVQFAADGTAIGDPVAVQSGRATFTTSSLEVGRHAITAAYAGSANFAGSRATLGEAVEVTPVPRPPDATPRTPSDSAQTVVGPASSPPEPATSLPRTGTPALPLAVSGLGLLLAGAGSIVLARRRAAPPGQDGRTRDGSNPLTSTRSNLGSRARVA